MQCWLSMSACHLLLLPALTADYAHIMGGPPAEQCLLSTGCCLINNTGTGSFVRLLVYHTCPYCVRSSPFTLLLPCLSLPDTQHRHWLL
jgi:hypothetical protein